MKTDTATSPPKAPDSKRVGDCSATSCSSCDGCQWQHEGEAKNWCYMFAAAPTQLPCTQHDKFEGERRAMGAMIRKCPAIIPMVVMGISETNE